MSKRAKATRINQGELPSEGRAALVRDDIFQRAMVLFERNGFRGTSMQDIADICGVTKPAIYYYFRSKYHFLQHLYDSVTRQFYAQIDSLAASRASPDAKLRGLIEMQVLYSVHNRQFQRLFQQERKELRGPAHVAIARCERKFESVVQGIIKDGQQNGSLRELDAHLSMMIILGLLSSVHRWAIYLKLSPREIAGGIVDVVLGGLSVRQKRSSAGKSEMALMATSVAEHMWAATATSSRHSSRHHPARGKAIRGLNLKRVGKAARKVNSPK